MFGRMNRYRLIIGLVALAFVVSMLSSCKGGRERRRVISESHTLMESREMTSAELKRWIDTTLVITRPLPYSISSRVNVQLGSHGVSGEIRYVAGEKIWVNVSLLGITFARALFTTDSLMYYERLRKTSYEGRWEELERVHTGLGVVDFHMMESMMFARPIFSLSKGEFTSMENGVMTFTQEAHRDGFNRVIEIDEFTHRITAQSITSSDDAISYTGEYTYDERGALKEMLFTVRAANYATVRCSYGVIRDGAGATPFSMPEGYKSVKELLGEIGIE